MHILVPVLASLVGNIEETCLEQLFRTAVEAHNTAPTNSIANVSATQAIAAVVPNAAVSILFPGDVASGSAAAVASCSPESVELMAASSPAQSQLPPLQTLSSDSPDSFGVDALTLNATTTTTSNIRCSRGDGSNGGGPKAPIVLGGLQLRQAALRCLVRLTDVLYLESMATPIIHPICRLLYTLGERARAEESGKNAKPTSSTATTGAHLALQTLFPPCMDVVANLVMNMGPGFKLVLPLVQVTLSAVNMSHPRFNAMLSQVRYLVFSCLFRIFRLTLQAF